MSTVDPGRVLALRDHGLSERQIARKLGASKTAVHRALKRSGPPPGPPGGPPLPAAQSGPPGPLVGAYTEADRETGLAALAAAAGNTAKASEWLRRDGHPIPAGVLAQWREDHRDRYQELRRKMQQHTRAQAATQSEDLAARYGQLEDKILTRLRRELPHLKADRLPDAAQKLAVARGISEDKARLHRGEATQVHEHRDWADIKQELAQRVPGLFVDSTAIEVPDEPEEPQEPAA